MEQHPVPQPISAYEFRLVGDMTIKQFGKLSAGIICALIVYGINPPPPILKWAFISVFVLLGVGMAFFPFEGRPIDTWILAFFRRIYSPTQFIWRPSTGGANKQNLPIQPSSFPVQPQSNSSNLTNSANQNSVVSSPPISPISPPSPSVSVPLQTTNYQPPTTPPSAVAPKFSSILIPGLVNKPNLVTGFVKDAEGKLVDGAVIEIRDQKGIPVRAFKSNKIGVFQTATPLPNGTFEIETEKTGLNFSIVKLDLTGQILPPLDISAQSATPA